MEHLFFTLIVHGVQALDRASRLAIAKAVPDYMLLRLDPARYFAEREVRIGPRTPYGSAGVVGLVCAAAVCVGLVLFAFDRPRGKKFGNRAAGIIVSTTVTFLAATALAARGLRGGRLTLRADGATLQFRGRSAFLPWELFATPGALFKPDGHRVVLPINGVVPVAVSSGSGWDDVPPASLKMPGLRGSADGQLTMKDLFNVAPEEVAALLLEIGRTLAGGAAVAAVTAEYAQPVAVPDGDGWLVRLTRLPLPPVCLGCGKPELATVEHAVSDGTNALKIAVPVCAACAEATWPRWLRAGLAMIGIGLMPASVLIAMVPRMPAFASAVIVMVGIAVGTIVLFAAFRSPKGPVSLSGYSAANGTVRMHLGQPEGEAALRSALGYESGVEAAD